MYLFRKINESNMPKFLKILIEVLLTLTCVYWIGVLIYKILEGLRIFMHWTSDKRNWWTFLMCVAILVVGGLIIAQFFLGLDPFGKMWQGILNTFNNFRNWLSGLIGTK